MKKCTKCLKEKPLRRFYISCGKMDSHCVDCKSARARADYYRRKEATRIAAEKVALS